MAGLALTHARSAGVKNLAAQTKAVQNPVTATMTGRLIIWGSAPMPIGDQDMRDQDMRNQDMGGTSLDAR